MSSDSISRGWVHFSEGRLEPAYQACRGQLESDEDNGYAWELLGLVLHDQGQLLESADALERASLLVAVCSEARIALAACYGGMQRRQLARDLYLELMLHGDLSVELMLQVAAGLESIDQPRLAMEACRQAEQKGRALDDDCDLAQVHYDMGFYAARAGYPPRISEALTRRAIELDPGNVHFRAGLVSMLIRLDRFEEAFDAVSTLSPTQIGEMSCKCCLQRIGNLLAGFGDAERASLCRQRLSELSPETQGNRVAGARRGGV